VPEAEGGVTRPYPPDSQWTNDREAGPEGEFLCVNCDQPMRWPPDDAQEAESPQLEVSDNPESDLDV
jgi:hypothetical protein